jgi:DNA repair protein SbcC/Rad50
MTELESVREVINNNFQYVKDLGNGIVRGERRYNDKPYAVAYIDLSDDIVQRAKDLQHFQEALIGPDFFSSDSDLRWNSYLFFWAGPQSKASEDKFYRAKSEIESDRHFARKFVLDGHDLSGRLESRTEQSPQSDISNADAGSKWEELLRADSLAMLLEQRPRTTTVELIENGKAFKAESAKSPNAIPTIKDALATGVLRQLTIDEFRSVHKKRTFDFGDVNLIVGPNGTGKTSLLEAIEILYCGRVRRDPGAKFTSVSGFVENLERKLVAVKATTETATLKSRNMAWYGRTDLHANAISQGFTRFNFLDTDAAFRLASDQSKEQIQADLARLLVGPDTSRLWGYLSSLKDDLEKRLRSVTDQIPGTQLNVELLGKEVARLRDAPSQSSSLVKSFRLSVAKLKPTWKLPVEGSSISLAERNMIASLLNAVQRVLRSATGTPVSKTSLNRQLSDAHQSLELAGHIQREYDSALKEANSAAAKLASDNHSLQLIAQWGKMLSAGVPGLAERLVTLDSQVSKLQKVLRAYPSEGLPAVFLEYGSLPLSNGLMLARERYEHAKVQEQLASTAQIQAEQLGQTLESLRRDLYDISNAYLERSGERELCPVCKTVHSEGELHEKIQALVATNASSVSDSLRHGVQLARERVEECRRILQALMALEAYRIAINAEDGLTPSQLSADAKKHTDSLQALATELAAARSESKSLNVLGLEFSTWEQIRDDARPLLPPDIDLYSAAQVTAELVRLAEQIERGKMLQSEKIQVMQVQSGKAMQLASDLSLSIVEDITPIQVRTLLERKLKEAEEGMAAFREISAALVLTEDVSIESVQNSLQVCLLGFDNAFKALESESSTGSMLKAKEAELQSVANRLSKVLASGTNLSRALETLTNIVDNHSLDKATADSFSIVRSKVSDVFAQIHSPPEYTLGNFSNGEIIIRRDNKSPHDVNQVSTGQRAALALSIFLALNESATTAPPILLIDDPVAHIDDLNALSFLDYLRDMVVVARKQVFFATADARLAALFQRKFEFLGERFKRISLAAT